MIGGALLFFVSPDQLRHVARILTLHELTEDPHDIVANYLLHTSQRLSPSVTTFGAIYLLSHGAVKVGLVAALLLGQRCAYPAAIVAGYAQRWPRRSAATRPTLTAPCESR